MTRPERRAPILFWLIPAALVWIPPAVVLLLTEVWIRWH